MNNYDEDCDDEDNQLVTDLDNYNQLQQLKELYNLQGDEDQLEQYQDLLSIKNTLQ